MSNPYSLELPHYAPGRATFPIQCSVCGKKIPPYEWFIVESCDLVPGRLLCIMCASRIVEIRTKDGRPYVYGRR